MRDTRPLVGMVVLALAMCAVIMFLVLQNHAQATPTSENFKSVSDFIHEEKTEAAADMQTPALPETPENVPESQPEPISEPVYEQEYEYTQMHMCEPSGGLEWLPSDGLTQQGGVNYYNGTRETWYSSNVLRHYRTDEWTPDDEGFYRTSDGYYVVASDAYEQGSVIATSKGDAMVLDSGCGDGVDFYTKW